MKKAFLSILLAAALLLTGCGGKKTNTAAPTAAPAPSPTAAPTAEPTPTPEPTVPPPDKSELGGTVENRSYLNRFFGIGCTLPVNWTYYSEEQIAELTGMAREKMDEDLAAAYDGALSAGDPLYCMVAASNKLNLNMTIQTADGLDAASVLSQAAEELVGALESMGMNGAETSADRRLFAGEERSVLRLSGQLGEKTLCIGVTALEAYGYIAVITAAAPTLEETDTILDTWYALEE